MTYYYDEVLRSRRHAFAAGVVAGALVIALIWVSLWAVGSSGLEEPAPAAPTGEALEHTAIDPGDRAESLDALRGGLRRPDSTAGDTRRVRCRSGGTQISRTNKLVTGVITLDEGMNVWDRDHGSG